MIENMDDSNLFKEFSDIKVVWINGSVWITNYTKIIEYSCELVRLKIKNNIVRISGINMSIKMLEKKEILLSGKIDTIELEKKYGKEVEKWKKSCHTNWDIAD